MKQQVEFGSKTLEYELARSKRRTTIGISVGKTGIQVTAPPRIPKTKIAEVVQTKGHWIVQQLRALDEVQDAPPARAFQEGESLQYLGRSHRIRFARSEGQAKVKLQNGFFEVHGDPETFTTHALRPLFESWFRRHAKAYFLTRIQDFARQVGHDSPPLHVRKQAKRWGSCTPSGDILVNWQLIAAPPRIVDYVIGHECCHLVDRTHGPEFRRVMRKIMPDYAIREEQLMREGAGYVMFA